MSKTTFFLLLSVVLAFPLWYIARENGLNVWNNSFRIDAVDVAAEPFFIWVFWVIMRGRTTRF
jgi:hypothetical protein